MKRQNCSRCRHWKKHRSFSGFCTNREWMEFTGKPVPDAFSYPTPAKTFANDGRACRAFDAIDTTAETQKTQA